MTRQQPWISVTAGKADSTKLGLCTARGLNFLAAHSTGQELW